MESLSAQRKQQGKQRGRWNPCDVSRQRWSPLEDAKLCEQVAIHGCSLPKWKKIAKELPGRSSNSCRYRWEKLTRGQETLGPAFCPPGFPMSSFYPTTPYWGCAPPVSVPVPVANMQWVPPPSIGGYYARSGEEVMNMEKEGERSLWIPKPLRIDDPDHEAAKSSIWTTLGIKNERGVAGHVNGGGGIFKAFQSNKKLIEEAAPPVLQPNLASSSSRSLN